MSSSNVDRLVRSTRVTTAETLLAPIIKSAPHRLTGKRRDRRSPEAAEVRRSVFGISPGSVSSPTARPQTEASSTRRTPRLSRMTLGPCDDVFSLPDPAYGQHRFRLGEIRI